MFSRAALFCSNSLLRVQPLLVPVNGIRSWIRMASAQAPAVDHDATNGTFSIAVPGGRGVLVYVRSTPPLGPPVIDIVSTRVPPSARGLGTAKILTDAAFSYARKEQALVKPSCSYVRDTYLSKGADGRPFTMDEAAGVVKLQ